MATAAEEFDRAFAAARRQGSKTFTHKGKEYTTETAEEDMLREYRGDSSGIAKAQARNYRDYVATNTPNESLSRGANLRGDAVRKLRTEGKIDDSGPSRVRSFKVGGCVRGDGIAIKGKTKGRVV